MVKITEQTTKVLIVNIPKELCGFCESFDYPTDMHRMEFERFLEQLHHYQFDVWDIDELGAATVKRVQADLKDLFEALKNINLKEFEFVILEKK